MIDQYLQHYGVKGMKWGRRRQKTITSSSTAKVEKRKMPTKEEQKRLRLEKEIEVLQGKYPRALRDNPEKEIKNYTKFESVPKLIAYEKKGADFVESKRFFKIGNIYKAKTYYKLKK